MGKVEECGYEGVEEYWEKWMKSGGLQGLAWIVKVSKPERNGKFRERQGIK